MKVIVTEGACIHEVELEALTEEVIANYFKTSVETFERNRAEEFMNDAENVTIETVHGKTVASYFDYDGEVSFLIEV